jgi:hypothetical protein
LIGLQLPAVHAAARLPRKQRGRTTPARSQAAVKSGLSVRCRSSMSQLLHNADQGGMLQPGSRQHSTPNSCPRLTLHQHPQPAAAHPVIGGSCVVAAGAARVPGDAAASGGRGRVLPLDQCGAAAACCLNGIAGGKHIHSGVEVGAVVSRLEAVGAGRLPALQAGSPAFPTVDVKLMPGRRAVAAGCCGPPAADKCGPPAAPHCLLAAWARAGRCYPSQQYGAAATDD